MNKSKAAFLFSAERLGKERLYLWTFTFREVLDIKATRKLWNHLLTLLRRKWPNLCGLRVFELHKQHGLHVHVITNTFIDVNEARKLAKVSGWGRIHVMRMPSEHAGYLAKYLSKHRERCLKGWRLWAGFGKWEWSRILDIELESPQGNLFKACKERFGWKGNRRYHQKVILIDYLYRRSMEEYCQ